MRQPMLDALLDEVARRRGIRPEDGLQVLGATALLLRPFDPGWPVLLLPDRAAADDAPGDAAAREVAQGAFHPTVLPGRAAHAGTAATLLQALYPAAHPVLGLAGAPDGTIGALSDADLLGAPHLVPALPVLDNLASPHFLPWLTARLRAPDGCPWDREQTHQSLRPFLLEETYEVYDALEHGGTPDLAEELGDLLLQIVLHAEHAAEEGIFDLTDVYRGIGGKIVRRHPHVFGDVRADTADQVVRNWEQIKRVERGAAAATAGGVAAQSSLGAAATEPAAGASGSAAAGATAGGERVEEPPVAAAFKGLARSLPALAYSQEMQTRAAALGYDWPDMEGVLEKLEEEALELIEADTDAHRREEFGDLLTVMVTLGRKLGIDAESALRDANAKFGRRFARVERLAAERERSLDRMTFEELDELWDAAKAAERDAAEAAERDAATSAERDAARSAERKERGG